MWLYAKKLNCTYAQFAITMPFPGNKLYDEAIKSGLIQLDDTWDKFVYAGICSGDIQDGKSYTWTAKELKFSTILTIGLTKLCNEIQN